MERDGPPHPPAFKNIRIGLTSLSLKYSAIFLTADSETSSIASTPSKKSVWLKKIQTCQKIGAEI